MRRRLLRWLLRRDPGLAASRRAVRIAVAASVAFLACRYGLGEPTVAVYAVFGVLGFGVFSDVSGTPAQRTRTIAVCCLAGLGLVALGSLLAVSTWAATVGVLVAGVVVGLLALGGPRAAGVVVGLHLLYILPSFPPFAPDQLPLRLTGLVIGTALLALADRYLLPPASPRPFARRAATGAATLADHLDALAHGRGPVGDLARASARRRGGCGSPSSRCPSAPPAPARSTAGSPTSPRRCAPCTTAWRPSRSWRPPRPTGAPNRTRGRCSPRSPGPCARSPRPSTGTARRPTSRGSTPPGPPSRSGGCTPSSTSGRGRGRCCGRRRPWRSRRSPRRRASSCWRRTPCCVPGHRPRRRRGRTWTARPGTPGRRRYGCGGAGCGATCPCARCTCRTRCGSGSAWRSPAWSPGELDVAHGFWVLLATLTLLRTSAASTRAALPPALLGTTIGGVLAVGLVLVVGPHPVAVAALLPVVVVVAVASGRLAGVVTSQACFTLVVAVLFTQLAPPTVLLGPERVLDVLLGAVVGLLVGAAIWPAGGHGEIRRAAALGLEDAAALVDDTTAWLAGSATRRLVAERLAATSVGLARYEATYTQFRSEHGPADSHPHDLDWMAVLGVLHRVNRGARSALADPPGPAEAAPWPGLAARLRADVEIVTDRYHRWATTLGRDEDPRPVRPPPPNLVRAGLRAVADLPDRAAHPVVAMRLVDAWGWLGWLADDLVVLERIAPAAAGASVTARGAP